MEIFSKKDNTHFIPEFFIKYNNLYYSVEISSDCEFIKVLIPDSFETNEIADEISLLSVITLYMKNYGIPEQRQLQALHNFKIGNMQNSILQLCMLDGNNIFPSCNNLGRVDTILAT